MLTDFVKMATGLVARGGLGLPLRISAFAAMVWAAWHAWLAYGVAFIASAAESHIEPLFVLPAVPLIVVVVAALSCACDPNSQRNRRRSDDPWGHWDFLRRAPFAVWCLITDDGRDVPVWAIVSWPAVAVVDFLVAVGSLIALPLRGLWIVLRTLGRLAWRGLDYRPLDRSR